jgi:hypothetical protein
LYQEERRRRRKRTGLEIEEGVRGVNVPTLCTGLIVIFYFRCFSIS